MKNFLLITGQLNQGNILDHFHLEVSRLCHNAWYGSPTHIVLVLEERSVNRDAIGGGSKADCVSGYECTHEPKCMHKKYKLSDQAGQELWDAQHAKRQQFLVEGPVICDDCDEHFANGADYPDHGDKHIGSPMDDVPRFNVDRAYPACNKVILPKIIQEHMILVAYVGHCGHSPVVERSDVMKQFRDDRTLGKMRQNGFFGQQ